MPSNTGERSACAKLRAWQLRAPSLPHRHCQDGNRPAVTWWLANSEQVRIQTIHQGRKQCEAFALERGKAPCSLPGALQVSGLTPEAHLFARVCGFRSWRAEFFCRNPRCQQRIKAVTPGIVVLFGKTHLQILKRLYTECVCGRGWSSTKRQNNHVTERTRDSICSCQFECFIVLIHSPSSTASQSP